MVYIRPSAPVVTPTAVKPVGDPSHAPQEHSLASDTVVNEFVNKPDVERRQPKDRRQQRKDALLETRAGRDRRKSKPTISITV